MDIVVNFNCPACGRTENFDLRQFSPAAPRRCNDCQARLELTPGGLRQLDTDLRRLLPGRSRS